MRLDKYLAFLGVGTRSQVKKIIRAGRLCVNGEIIRVPEEKIDEENDIVTLDGTVLVYNRFCYFMLHKPAGCVTAVSDDRYPTVMDYLSKDYLNEASPVGRLDLDTEGLLIITNDGELAHRLISPAYHVEKTYFARLNNPCPREAEALFLQGVDIGDKKLTLPAKLEILEDARQVRLTIKEGRYHQVKRMFLAVGCEVIYLKRESFGPLSLGELALGEYRALTSEELETLKKTGKK